MTPVILSITLTLLIAGAVFIAITATIITFLFTRKYYKLDKQLSNQPDMYSSVYERVTGPIPGREKMTINSAYGQRIHLYDEGKARKITMKNNSAYGTKHQLYDQKLPMPTE